MNTNRRIALSLLTLLLIWCFCRVCDARAQEYHTYHFGAGTFRLHKYPQLDRWSSVHFMGCTFGYFGFRAVGLKPVPAMLSSIGMGLFYEVWKDGFHNTIPFTGGRDVAADLMGDMAMHITGACFGGFVEYAFKQLTGKKGKIYMHNGKAYLVVEL